MKQYMQAKRSLCIGGDQKNMNDVLSFTLLPGSRLGDKSRCASIITYTLLTDILVI